ncbi:probable indole-3-pyruvate monooxygenase YUCCA10 [Jatropha curcas]|uniref:probable indole-3-pyruvate monooxygenase YUCCA10 n=1 Tax=Jatropha curcas TaxID=180498 RepID=UPI00189631D6|nr:probable indole-3-pyruvate monooxygenase YUCCA10 [Jatropha curcas]
MSVCLSNILVSNIMLEKEDCHASLWKRRSYNRLHLHLAKEFCELPYMPHLPETPTFMPKETFIDYMDKYVREYNLSPLFSRYVVSASFDQVLRKWIVEAENSISGEIERYVAKFLVVATGENSSPYIPGVPGVDSFSGSLIHSSQYKNGSEYGSDSPATILSHYWGS